ncbi:hypothetical protein DLAC_03986 [Tieghemostelium lacteum]|uniref:Oligosaccharyltransferase complex subunit n=1 Tax=Tieghemostelium lacteum TaxID=361077 RepID=A0A151ZRR4_TIELA|nr:hypothetical protein DLAC_03986 [Tieghemostelium lacteum]|eukprot:KYQ96693.1 hypothetical protein DLAC_03986 [Tieghemostelium lacteum]
MASLLEAPFKFVKVPRFRLKVPNINKPAPMFVFALVFLSYFLVSSGIIYDLIVEPPSIGYQQDERGNSRPMVFQMYRINGQFIIEGLSAGFVFALGALGVIILDFNKTKDNSYVFAVGVSLIFAAFNIAIVFLRMKIPGYSIIGGFNA